MWELWVDTGGTFTDCVALSPDKKISRHKVLSDGSLRAVLERSEKNRLFLTLKYDFPDDFLKGYFLLIPDVNKRFEILHSSKNVIHILEDITNFPKIVDVKITAFEEPPVLAARIATDTSLHDSFPSIHVKLGSTRGTNALLENKGNPPVLLVTSGFRDLLKIGTQQRKNLFSLNVEKKRQLYTSVIEVNEEINSNGEN